MEKVKSVLVLIRFKQLNLCDKVVVDTDVLKTNPGKEHLKRMNLPIRSISLCTSLSRQKKTSKFKNVIAKRNSFHNLLEYEREIDNFEKDFVIPVLRNLESDKSSCSNTILSAKVEAKILHSSSDSIHTDSDSGIFSRVSSADRDSEDSDSSDRFQTCSDESDHDAEEGHKKTNTSPSTYLKRTQINIKNSFPLSTRLSIHKNIDCEEIVTVNGVCYHCMQRMC